MAARAVQARASLDARVSSRRAAHVDDGGCSIVIGGAPARGLEPRVARLPLDLDRPHVAGVEGGVARGLGQDRGRVRAQVLRPKETLALSWALHWERRPPPWSFAAARARSVSAVDELLGHLGQEQAPVGEDERCTPSTRKSPVLIRAAGMTPITVSSVMRPAHQGSADRHDVEDVDDDPEPEQDERAAARRCARCP